MNEYFSAPIAELFWAEQDRLFWKSTLYLNSPGKHLEGAEPGGNAGVLSFAKSKSCLACNCG